MWQIPPKFLNSTSVDLPVHVHGGILSVIGHVTKFRLLCRAIFGLWDHLLLFAPARGRPVVGIQLQVLGSILLLYPWST